MTETKTVDIGALIGEYVQTVNALLPRLCGSTVSSVLRAGAERLGRLRATLREGKLAARQNFADDIANDMLGRESLVTAMFHEAQMWLALRDERPHDAWHEFVDAEQHFALALRTPVAPEFEQIFGGRFERLQAVLFPRMMYTSCGFNHGPGRCTICDGPLNACKHIKGRIYAGQVCAEFGMASVELDHVAIVEHPMSKHCYMSHQRKPGGAWLDRLSGELAAHDDFDETSDSPLELKAILFENRLPPGSRL